MIHPDGKIIRPIAGAIQHCTQYYRKTAHAQEHDRKKRRTQENRRSPGSEDADPGTTAELRLNMLTAEQQVEEDVAVRAVRAVQDGQVQPRLGQVLQIAIRDGLHL